MPALASKPTRKRSGGVPAPLPAPCCPFCGHTGELEVVRIPTTNPAKSFRAGVCTRCGAQGPHGWTDEEARQGWTARLSPLDPLEAENSIPFLERPECRQKRFGDARHWPVEAVTSLARAGWLALAAVRRICAREDNRLRPEIKPTSVNLTVCARNLPGAILAFESVLDTLREWAGNSDYAKEVRYDMAHGGMRARGGGYPFSYTLAAAGKPFRPTTKPKKPTPE